MADRQSPLSRPPPRTTPPNSPNLLRRIHQNHPGSVQLFGLLTLIVTGGILVLFTGLTITVSLLGLILFSPIIILTSPIWIPVAAVAVFVVGGFLCLCGAAVVTVASASWLYKYFKGLHPIGAERVDYARSQIANTASHVKDYAREYGGYLQSKVKDAAPGALTGFNGPGFCLDMDRI